MNILHYTLGLFPYRSGGLTKYASDLMSEQAVSGHKVFLLYPGGITWNGKPRIRKRKNHPSIDVYEIQNSVVVPLFYGIKKTSYILEQNRISNKYLDLFYNEIQPDVLHIHSWMGFPIELLFYFKEKGVKVIYTSHDYYGLCLKVNFIDNQGKLCLTPDKDKCAKCNARASNKLFLRVRNSPILSLLKRYIPNHFKRKLISTDHEIIHDVLMGADYQEILDHYKLLFSKVDMFHFNSILTRNIYSKFIPINCSEVISITHKDIIDKRIIKNFDQTKIRLAFIGNQSVYKGFPMLKEVLLKVEGAGITNWTLNVYGGDIAEDPHTDKIHYCGKYRNEDIAFIFHDVDLLIVPSLCPETFSLITLEALSLGVPVLVSDNVGARDLIVGFNIDFIFKEKSDLLQILCDILRDVTILEEYNKRILQDDWIFSMEKHSLDIIDLYKKI